MKNYTVQYSETIPGAPCGIYVIEVNIIEALSDTEAINKNEKLHPSSFDPKIINIENAK